MTETKEEEIKQKKLYGVIECPICNEDTKVYLNKSNYPYFRCSKYNSSAINLNISDAIDFIDTKIKERKQKTEVVPEEHKDEEKEEISRDKIKWGKPMED